MKLLETDAVGAGEKELRYGFSFLKANIERSGLPVVCSNLYVKGSAKPALTPYIIKKVGTVKVGIFSLMSDKVAYGPSQDSLRVEEPAAAARRVIAEMRKKGATVTVLLSNLGKVDSEDLVAAVPGVDVLVVGHASSLLMKGRMIKNTVAGYGGEKGQYMGRTLVTLDAKKAQATGENEAFMLGPEVGERAEIAKLVKAFDDGFNEKLRKSQQESAAKAAAAKGQDNPDRFLGAELCMRCHQSEGEQWRTTSHAVAWKTLTDGGNDTKPECVSCHVVGYRRPGGFQSVADAPKLANVQCENCHGMGTMHEAFSNPHKAVTEQVCQECHQGENDQNWNWSAKRPLIVHSNKSGETLKKKTGATTMPKAGSH
ncbi:MAG TPA: multiheme c-type cytochrome [Candidatus Eisenbacteria bacterium]|nr:multiheme c-type cytochrome [Candidatus Eisenbacteria bacterium]